MYELDIAGEFFNKTSHETSCLVTFLTFQPYLEVPLRSVPMQTKLFTDESAFRIEDREEQGVVYFKIFPYGSSDQLVVGFIASLQTNDIIKPFKEEILINEHEVDKAYGIDLNKEIQLISISSDYYNFEYFEMNKTDIVSIFSFEE